MVPEDGTTTGDHQDVSKVPEGLLYLFLYSINLLITC